ncbi:MAG: DUF5123 domain-containing protein [Calditrichaeota bacterium]|nr:MAG: DUF5123 domain-containing protein [Calditrichota bacterium]MBL1208118.1 DUF5123 domain-containing protein [Calditrichota bacterium]NOG47956.1 DUF5123 domain-containing protein [Calditrichota bacterium]
MKMFILVFISAIFSFGNEIFVSSALEIKTALTSIVPGDTLTMVEGTWTDQQIKFNASGTSEQPILLRAKYPGKTKLSGLSNLRISGEYLIVDGLSFINGRSPFGAVIEFRGDLGDAQNCRLTNTAIENYNPTNPAIEYKWISLYGKNNRVDHCYLRGKNNSGATIVVWLNNQANYHTIDSNYFGYRPDLGENGGETIRIGTSDWSLFDSYTTVENNYFERCNGEIEIISNKSGHNTFRYNTFYECAGTLTLRHGNYATVTGNFFIGNNKSNTGGVRIIGENHIVYNNYFQDLTGSGLRAALSIMNGVPNSPLNRYFQVKNAHVLYNSFVNCRENIILGAGADSERTLPPLDCSIDNNVILSNTSNFMVDEEDTPINLTWSGNIFFGSSLGIDQPEGILITDPKLLESGDGLWRPESDSPLLGAAEGDFEFVTIDMDGQNRLTPFDVGADQNSDDPVIYRPLTADDAGPNWYPLPAKVFLVPAEHDSLMSAVYKSVTGDTIELTDDGGIYTNSSEIIINKNVFIRASDGLSGKPIIRNAGSSGSGALFVIVDGGNLTLNNLKLDGMAGTETPAKYLIRTDSIPMTKNYNLRVKNCDFYDVVSGSEGNFFRAFAGTFADTISFENCLFYNSGEEGIRLNDEALNSSLYNVGYLGMTNCTMWHTNKEAINIYAGDEIIFTPGPHIRIDHCTFDDCGYNSAAVLVPKDVTDIKIHNSIFTNSSGNSPSITLSGFLAEIAYCDTFNISGVVVENSAVIGAGMLGVDPQYTDAPNGDFTLLATSPLGGKANDGEAMGDLRWADNVTTIDNSPRKKIPQKIALHRNYPNPFNPSTTIEFYLPKILPVRITIHDITGKIVDEVYNGIAIAGTHNVKWNAGSSKASGIYLYRLKAGNYFETKKMMLIK